MAPNPLTSTHRQRLIADAFDPRHNSLNFIRLVLALIVAVAHAAQLGSFSGESFLNRTTTGAVAVYGFFGISGFLVARSATTNRPGNYLWRRFLRIFPAFWICLVLTGFLFGLLVYARRHSSPLCDFSCFLDPSKAGPLSYLYRNSYLEINQTLVSPSVLWLALGNLPLWTLFYEFLCYLLLLALAVLGLLRRRALTVVVTLTL